MIDSPPQDEDVLEIPAKLRGRLHPRRGGTPVPPVPIDRAARARAGKVVAEAVPDAALLESLLVGGPRWVESARRYLAGEADPAGAAAVTLVSCLPSPAGDGAALPTYVCPSDAVQSAHVNAWAGEHGLAFAACALVEQSTVKANVLADGPAVRLMRGKEILLGKKTARRMRALLAAADESEYQEAVERLAEHRRTDKQKAVVSYLIPTRQDWLDECELLPNPSRYQEDMAGWLLRHAFATPAQLARKGVLSHGECPASLPVTLVDAAGTGALPLFVEGLDDYLIDAVETRRLLEAIGLLPCDEAMRELIDRVDEPYVRPALLAAMDRFPVRALRLLAASDRTDLLAEHVRVRPGIVAAALPGLAPRARAAVEAVAVVEDRVAAAGPDELPPLLTEPPWTRETKAAGPVVIAGLTPPAARTLSWAPGERDEWAATYVGSRTASGKDWPAEVRKYRAEHYNYVSLFSSGPEDLVRPLLVEWTERHYLYGDDVPWLKSLLSRYGTDAFPLVTTASWITPGESDTVLLPCLSPEVAALMADWLSRRGPARTIAIAWFGRHGADAARMLVPAALGKARKPRERAGRALRLLAGGTGTENIVAVAREYGTDAADAIGTFLAAGPLEIFPARVPVVGEWAAPSLLPQILLLGGTRALPDTATAHVLTMLAMSRPDEVYAGVDVLRDLCDARSLAAFSWALFECWERNGAPVEETWALDQLGLLGDDGTVRALTPVIRAWPGEGGHRKAASGLDVLAAIGTDVALTHLYDLSRRVRFKGLKARAKDKIEEVAAARGLSPERLEDRLVPDFGLDPDGSMTLDYGPRRFTVGFDEALVPYVLDEDGRRRKTLPKPAAGDDAEIAPDAYERFASMKKEARAAATGQVRRLESAMVTLRRWTAAEFRDLFAEHPLVRHIARRLVWLAEAEAGDGGGGGDGGGRGAATAFRIAEDRTFADVRDAAFDLPDSASVGIAHPLDLGDDLAVWKETLEDYEILQPFPQAGRETYALTEEEGRGARLARFEGRTVRTVKVFALRHRGWDRTDSAGTSLGLPGGRRAVVEMTPGLHRDPDEQPEQRLTAVRLFGANGREAPFGDLHPVTASEVIADLGRL